MQAPLHFYFDFSSPYGYFAAMHIEALAGKYQRKVEWHPVLLGAIFKITECQPLIQIPLKGKYSAHDLVRTARFHHIPFAMPAIFPLATHLAARAVLWLINTQGQDSAGKFVKAVYQAYFVDGVNIGDALQLAQIATNCGFDAAALTQATATPEIKEQLKLQVDSAIEHGVFGSPFMIVDEEPFWGFDRFDQLEAHLKNGKI